MFLSKHLIAKIMSYLKSSHETYPISILKPFTFIKKIRVTALFILTPCSGPSFLMTWPRKLSCLLVMTSISSLLTPALLKTSLLVTLSKCDIRRIHLRNHISAASMLCSSSLVIVQASHPYIKIDHMQHLSSLVLSFMDRFRLEKIARLS